jgi:hypothetical protein
MRESLKTTLLLAGSCLVALLVAELATRLFLPVDPSAYDLDDRYIFRFKPHTWTWFRHSKVNGGARILIESNSLGYRGPEPDLSPRRTRIAVYGDSFIHAAFSPLPETYARQLQDALHARGRSDVQVLNAGTSGYGPDQNSLRIEDELERIRPAAVMLAVYTGNDFGDLMRNKIYRLQGDALVPNDYAIAPETRELFERKRRLFDEGSLLNHSNLVRAVKRALYSRQELRARGDDTASRFGEPRHTARLIKARHREYRKFVLDGDNLITIGQDGYDADVSVVPDSESAVYKKALMEGVLAHVTAAHHPLGHGLRSALPRPGERRGVPQLPAQRALGGPGGNGPAPRHRPIEPVPPLPRGDVPGLLLSAGEPPLERGRGGPRRRAERGRAARHAAKEKARAALSAARARVRNP